LKIVFQNPRPGTLVPLGTAVGVTLENPPPPRVKVPPLTGRTVAQASALLSAFSLRLGTVTGQVQSPVPLKIVSQSPQPGTLVAPDTAVGVALETPPPPRVKVPSLTWRTVAQAKEILGGVGLGLGAVAGEVQGRVAQKIVSQSPQAGDSVPPGTTVGVTLEQLSQPPPPPKPPQTTWHKVAWGVGLVLLGVGVGAFFRPKVPPQNLPGVTTTTTPTTVAPPTVVTMKPEPNVAQTRTVTHVAPKIKLVVRLRGLPGPGVYDVRRETTIVSRKDGRA
jgi:beta-lactam-binding protein with PASTA domain